MTIFLLLIPILAAISGIILYPHTGKREFLKLDFVQFFYTFVLTPFLFVWLKSFIFLVLRQELGLRLTYGQLLLIDTIVSVIFLYIFGFVVVHALTKTFSLKITQDPLYDIFRHAEFFHLDLSHLVMYIGVMALATLLSLVNLIVPFQVELAQTFFYGLLFFGVMAAVAMFTITWLYESPEPNYMRLMKAAFGVNFLIHIGIYLWRGVPFGAEYGAYWFFLVFFTSLVGLSLFAERPEEKRYRWYQRLPFAINPYKIKYYYRFFRNKSPF